MGILFKTIVMEERTGFSESNMEKPIENTSELEINDNNTSPLTVDEDKNSESEIDFNSLKPEEYTPILKQMTSSEHWVKKRKEIQEVISKFENQFSALYEEKKKEHFEEKGNYIDFHFEPIYKKEFNQILKEYKSKKSTYYKSQEKSQKENLEKCLQIIEQIKTLIDAGENSSNSYKEFKALQENWRNIGTVPRADSNNIWQTYKHHVERFYDFFHLDRDLRDKNFKHNYKEKLKLIERAEELVGNPDIIFVIRELNALHRQWKNDLGPVAREHQEELWGRFQIATAKIHEQKSAYDKSIETILKENLDKKKEILANIKLLCSDLPNNHNAWQNSFKKIDKLKEDFYNIGRIPKHQNKAIWNEFRTTLRDFNYEKNQFYKAQKNEEKASIKKKRELISEVQSIIESPDLHLHLNRMKAVQQDWKKTGRISRKLSNKLWEEFKKSTDLYFYKLKNKEKTYSEAEQKIIDAKHSYFEELKKQVAPTKTEDLLAHIETAYAHWNSIGSISNGTKNKLYKEFTSFLLSLWEQTELKGVEKEATLFKTNLLFFKNNPEQLNKEHHVLSKKIDESKTELMQLENNLAFFNSSSIENPLVKEVSTKIKLLTNKIENWKAKLKQIRILSKKIQNDTDVKEE